MSQISSNTLFHFTNSIQNLENILLNTFHPRYCFEDYSSFYGGEILANQVFVPMVSFCDIPLSQINEHCERYGSYAIGMTRKWGYQNLINPVIYLTENSIQFDALRSIFESYRQLKHESLSKIDSHTIDLLRFIKPYRGISNKDNKEIIFYNEREWRYTPKSEDLDKRQLSPMLWPENLEGVSIETYNNILSMEFQVSFEPQDIDYIIVEKEQERLEIAKKINVIKRRYNKDERLLLTTKIISMEKIRSDF